MSKAYSGRDAEDISVEDVRTGKINLDDIRIHPDTLEYQAQVALKNGNPQLAANFRRAAELTEFSDNEVLALYESLRPGRSSAQELKSTAEQLKARGAHRNAQLFAQAADVYERRSMVKK